MEVYIYILFSPRTITYICAALVYLCLRAAREAKREKKTEKASELLFSPTALFQKQKEIQVSLLGSEKESNINFKYLCRHFAPFKKFAFPKVLLVENI